MVLGNNQDNIDPRRKLDFMLATGMTGNRAISKADALLVNSAPPNTKPRDTVRAAMGPLNAKSNRAARLGGKDLRGVMHPNKGDIAKCNDGIGTGNPIFMFLRLAIK